MHIQAHMMPWNDAHIQEMNIRKINIINLSYIYTPVALYLHDWRGFS